MFSVDSLAEKVVAAREQQAAAAATLTGVAHPNYVDAAVRALSLEADARFLATPSRLPANTLAKAGLFLPPPGFGQHPRCYRCDVEVDFQCLVVGQSAEYAHRLAVAASDGLVCTLRRTQVPSVFLKEHEGYAAPAAKKPRQ
jgi:hypothetical protein